MVWCGGQYTLRERERERETRETRERSERSERSIQKRNGGLHTLPLFVHNMEHTGARGNDSGLLETPTMIFEEPTAAEEAADANTFQDHTNDNSAAAAARSGVQIETAVDGEQPVSSGVTPVGLQLPPFLVKTYEMVDDEATTDLVSWSDEGKRYDTRASPTSAYAHVHTHILTHMCMRPLNHMRTARCLSLAIVTRICALPCLYRSTH